jgi:hypothetical protein
LFAQLFCAQIYREQRKEAIKEWEAELKSIESKGDAKSESKGPLGCMRGCGWSWA